MLRSTQKPVAEDFCVATFWNSTKRDMYSSEDYLHIHCASHQSCLAPLQIFFLRRGGMLIIGLLSIPGFIGSSAIIVGLVGRIRGTDISNANRRARDSTTNTEERVGFKK